MGPSGEIEKLTSVVEEMMVSIYILRSENIALQRVFERQIDTILSEHEASDLRKFLIQQKVVALDEIVLSLGDTEPRTAERLQMFIDASRRRSVG